MKARNLIALLLALAMVLGMTACGGSTKEPEVENQGGEAISGETPAAGIPEYLNMDSQLPIVKEGTDITLTVLIVNGPMYTDMSSIHDVYFVDAYEKKTGVKIEWETVDSASFNDKLTLMLADGKLPDVILKGGVSNTTQMKYGDQGYFLNLMENGMLETFAPNYWALCQKYPEVLSSSMMPDGAVYSMGMIRNSTGSTISSKLFFNQEWLDAVNMEVPTTSEEFYNVLKAFKENDPNGNGKADEIGLYLKPDHLQYVTFGMFGIGNRGANNKHIDCDPDTGAVRYFPATEEFRSWVEFVSKLYQEGLLAKEFFDFTESNLGNHVKNDVCGVFAYTNLCMLDQATQQKFTYLDGAMTGPEGHKDYFGVNSIGTTGSYLISTSCPYPEVALRWADYFFSDEGSLFFYFGDEGVTYDALEDGTYQFNDTVLSDFYSGAETYDGCAVRVSLYGYGNTPTMTKVPYNSADDNKGIALEAANALIEDCAIAWPSFTFTKEEQWVLQDYKEGLDDFVNGKRDSWIMGTEELNDETWNAFLEQIQKREIQQILDVYEAALSRAYESGLKDGYHTLNEFE